MYGCESWTVSYTTESCVKGQNLEGAGGSLQGSGRARSSPRVPAHSQILEGVTTTWGLASNADVQANLADSLIQQGSGRAQASAFLASALHDSAAVVCVAHIPRTQCYKWSPPLSCCLFSSNLLSCFHGFTPCIPGPQHHYSSSLCWPALTDPVNAPACTGQVALGWTGICIVFLRKCGQDPHNTQSRGAELRIKSATCCWPVFLKQAP